MAYGQGRLSIRTGSGEAELKYAVENGVMGIYHTFVPETERGKGLAEKLAVAAFALAKERGVMVRPDCDYIRRFVERHAEYAVQIANEK